MGRYMLYNYVNSLFDWTLFYIMILRKLTYMGGGGADIKIAITVSAEDIFTNHFVALTVI